MYIESRVQLIDLLRSLNLTKGIAEIGVAEGGFSETMVKWETPMLYLIDRWESFTNEKGDGSREQEWHDYNYSMVLTKMNLYEGRYTILKGDSVVMAGNIPDGSLSMVYLDADHNYEGAKRDIEAWYPKVEVGGVIAGHDYLNEDYGVNRAIKEFVNDRFEIIAIPENELNNASFYFIKTQ